MVPNSLRSYARHAAFSGDATTRLDLSAADTEVQVAELIEVARILGLDRAAEYLRKCPPPGHLETMVGVFGDELGDRFGGVEVMPW